MAKRQKRNRQGPQNRGATPQDRSSSRPAAPRTDRVIWVALAVLLGGILAYSNCLQGVFLFDDARYIEDQPAIRSLWPPGPLLATRRPLVRLTLALNYAVSGFDPWSYHALNLGIHLAAGLVLLGLLRRVLLRPVLPEKIRRGATGIAGAVALLWTVHPLGSQCVMYTIQRGESLMGLWYLLTLYTVVRGAESGRSRPGRGLWYAAAVVACGLGMASKAVMVTAPLMVLLMDGLLLSSSFRESLRRRWGLYAALAGMWSILALVGVVRGVLAPPADAVATVGFGYQGISPGLYVWNQAGVLLHYLRLTLWPHPLCLDYVWPIRTISAASAVPVALLVLLVAITLLGISRRRPVAFPGIWFLVILAPTSSFIPIKDLCFEHRMYLPLAGMISLVVVGAVAGLDRMGDRWSWPEGTRRAMATGLVLLTALPLGAATHQRNRAYRSRLVMWQDVLSSRPTNPRAWHNLGQALEEKGREVQAAEHYLQALRLNPNLPEPHLNLGLIRKRQGRLEKALRHLEEAVRLNPRLQDARMNLASALREAGRTDQAIQQYQYLLDQGLGGPRVHYNLANVYLTTGDLPAAERHYQEAVQRRPEYVQAWTNLALAQQRTGSLTEASVSYRKALELDPDFFPAVFNLALLQESLGRIEEARHLFRRAQRLRPGHPRAQAGLQRLPATASP